MNMISLSVCIITKNESAKLEKCLQRLQPYGFEIVLVDTGSIDGTKEMAKQYTSHIHNFAWCDDFAAAKNYAISKAVNDMVMVLDSDEYLEPMQTDVLYELMQKHKEMVGRICIHNIYSIDKQQNENVEYINRIFDRTRFHYEGKIHEQLVAKDGSEYQTYLTPVTVLHSGYDGTKEERIQKARRNLELLQQTLEENPKDTYILYQLGKSYYMAEDYPKAVRYFELALGYDVNPKLEYVVDMVETYGYALLKTGQAEIALSLEGVYQEFASSADFVFLMGLIYMNNEMFEEAVTQFVKAAEYQTAKTVGVNSYLAYYNAGVIRECLGDVKQAKEYYRKCGEYGKAVDRLGQLD